MLPLYRDPHFTFYFADCRIISRFHLQGVTTGVQVSVYQLAPVTHERQNLILTATVGEGGWVDLPKPIVVRSGEGFVAIPHVE